MGNTAYAIPRKKVNNKHDKVKKFEKPENYKKDMTDFLLNAKSPIVFKKVDYKGNPYSLSFI